MTTRSLSVLGAVSMWMTIDLWRLWSPSLITLFGRAAQTPPEVMGAYALVVMAVPLVIVALFRARDGMPVVWLLAAAFVVRIVLAANPNGGDVQLYGSSLGVVLGVSAVCVCAGVLGRSFVPSILLGVALSASTHAILGTFGAVWRRDGWDVALLIVQAVLILAAARGASRLAASPVSARTAFLVFPVLLILLLALVNPGRGSALHPLWGPIAVVVGAWAAVAASVLPAPRRRPWVAGVAFIGAVALSVLLEVTRGGIEGTLSWWAVLGFVAGPAAAARLLVSARRGSSPRTAAVLTGAGAVVWTALFFAYYAGYDLGYRADVVIVVAAVLVAVWAVAARPVQNADGDRAERARIDATGARAVGAATLGAVAAVVLALVGPVLTIPTRAVAASDDLTVAAYNLRMGYGLDGRFVPREVADQVRAAGAHVVLLSEIDRGWLLNGGQDQLAIMARMLGMHLVFGPASDQVWGDAILTDLPVRDVRSQRYPAFASLTGAGMTMATVDWRGTAVRVISTHLQPDGDELNETQGQAAIFARTLAAAAAQGPVVGGGDLNTTPGSAAWTVLQGSGTDDALAGIRPAYTSPADAPTQQIDHLFVSGLAPSGAEVVDSTLSDHRMIVVRLRVAE
ncbi:hypothetical protein ET475_09355 [Microbacterium protaetiae]|uniref:Endonuclease/exonuclease/phosphatase domain-containing protein n=1 Tax=Microbacterium protaetiae TaxID=2509458 RepID=A0A4P6EDH0_9MICO|nr:endonuclease/exonuclease/phosphatase family protein [Microbacterium protaetiae]QAY60174.1 hypothetical protein ET475_09355 [Microbacterium protaetiae]